MNAVQQATMDKEQDQMNQEQIYYGNMLEYFNQNILNNPNDFNAFNGKGIALYYLGKKEEAIASYDQALKINPSDEKIWTNRGNALFDLGRYEEAIASYDQALEINPDYHEAWDNWRNVLAIL